MAENVKIITEDVLEILDTKIKTSSVHLQLDVVLGEFYDSVLTKIAARSPTLLEKQGLDAALSPSSSNHFVTFDEMNVALVGKIPWKTIGQPGTDSDFEGTDETPFLAALASGVNWIIVKEGTWTFANPITIPSGIRLMGTGAGLSIVQGALTPFTLSSDTIVSHMTIQNTLGATTPVIVISPSTSNVDLSNLIVESVNSFIPTLSAIGADSVRGFDCAFFVGSVVLDTCTNSMLSSIICDCPTVESVFLNSCTDVSVIGCIMVHGIFRVVSGDKIRALGNHFNDSISSSPWGTDIIFRANTPKANNNEEDDFSNLIQYIGTPDIYTPFPPYSSNYAGPSGQDLTTRASALDLLVQWKYEERNFLLMAPSEPWTVTWNPAAGTITTTAEMKLMSMHRDGSWVLPTISGLPLTDGWALYYVIDRSLDASDILLTPQFAALGTIPNNSDNRQVWVLAFRLGNTLWWRGGNAGGGVRFPGTGGQSGTYFIDGVSKSFLDYVGATDINDADPNYSNSFAGIQGESLTTRLGKTDTLIKRLFEYSNLGWYFDTPTGYIGGDTVLTLSTRLYFTFPHAVGRVYVEPQSWTIADGEILYLTWDQSSLGSDQQISPTTGNIVSYGSLPLPDDNLTLKYFVFARCLGSSIWLWDGTEVPLSGGRWPVPDGRGVVRTAPFSLLSDNIVWDGSKLYWENLAVWTSTGLPLTRNSLVNNTAGTTVSSNQALRITFSWNTGVAANVTVDTVSVPLVSPLKQNQFLFAQNLGGSIIFGG